jgi:RNA polymerase sigma-70 factor, ECF subfamily
MTAAVTQPLSREDFAQLAEPFRDELLAHCYRMLGSRHDAEDQVQETLLRAWRSAGTFEGRASLRTWLYKIATNACLRALETRARRPLPAGLGAPASGAEARDLSEIAWLEPFPESRRPRADPADPASIVAARADLRLALIAALQYLPARQRAVLILRDVLGWRAAEVAGLLGTSAAAVNSMLQRARAQLGDAAPARDQIREPADPRDQDLVARYAAAFAAADVAGLIALLTADAVFEMPPEPDWFAGRAAIGAFLAARVLTAPGRFALVPAAANGQPALATYELRPDGAFQADALQVLTITGGQVARVTAFRMPALFEGFGLPVRLAG